MGTYKGLEKRHDRLFSVCGNNFIEQTFADSNTRSPTHPEYKVIKRVIAKEGDTVITRAPCPVPTVQIPRNHIWVEGDNRDPHKTLDSNTYGPIPLNLVDGRITYVLSPWKSFGPVRWDDFKGRTKVIKGRPGQAPGW